jgi:alpha(1,3/1,4) fucosyltransferase
MYEKLKIKFTDFWIEMNQREGNYFYQLLSQKYDLEFSDDPDILFYSNYGKEYLKYDCIRIFYSAENMRPDFTGCDYAITFDFIDKKNSYRFPLYGMYCEPENMLAIKSREQTIKEWEQKEKFCCMVVSNPESKTRIDFFRKLCKYKMVDSGGKYLNNVGGPVINKLEFIKNYKFVFAFENSSYPGYTTEKVIEPIQANCIPIYWGNPLIAKDINSKRIVNYYDYENEEELINDILEIETNPERAIDILSEPAFPGNQIPVYIDPNKLLNYLDGIISSKGKVTPVAQTNKKIVHMVRKRSFEIRNSLIHKFRR